MNNQHFPNLIKYIGISFITGAIAHGFFSGTRQILTAIFGVLCFTIGTILEKNTENTLKNILLSVGLAIAFGAVTGGLQHFPDSPERSVWIFPVGILASIPLFSIIHKEHLSRKYIILLSLFWVISSLILYTIIENTGLTWHSHENAEQNTLSITVDSSGSGTHTNIDTNTHTDATSESEHGH